MSLRARLLVTVLALLAFGLVTTATVVYGVLRANLNERADAQLRAAGQVAAELFDGRPLTEPLFEVSTHPDSAELWHTVADSGGAPSFFQIRDPAGRIVQTAAVGTAPSLPGRLEPAPVEPDNTDGEVFHRVDAESADEPEQNWRFRSAWLPDHRGYLIVGMRMTGAEGFAGTLAVVLLAASAVVLGVVALFGWLAVRAFRQRDASEQRLRQFVADASHELRTPVAAVRGYAELFRRGAAERPDDLATAMHRIESEAERMGLLVDELLLLAQLDEGRPLELATVDLAQLATEAVAGARAVEPDRRLDLRVDGPVPVHGDAARLRQVLDNLLANVRQHTPPRTAAAVRVTVERDKAVLEVSDQGAGLTEDQCAMVFARFYRAGTARSHHPGGAGLGLSIVAAVVAAHGGDATVYSEHGSGATFRVRLPVIGSSRRQR